MKRAQPFRGVVATLTFGAVFGLAECDGAVGPDETDPVTSEGANAIAGFMSDVDYLSLGIMTVTSSVGSRSLSRTVPCPSGGTVSVSGSSESSRDDRTRIVSTHWTSTKSSTACAVSRTRGDRTLTAVVDGSITTAGSSSWQLPESRDGQRTLLSWASTTKGSTTTTVGDRSSTCVVDVKETYDPGAKTFTITGTMCGREVNVTRGLDR